MPDLCDGDARGGAIGVCGDARVNGQSLRHIDDDDGAAVVGEGTGHTDRSIAMEGTEPTAVSRPAIAQVATWWHGQDPADPVAWRGPQEQLARMLGLSRVTVNRALSRLVGAGAVWLTDRGIAIADREGLARFSSM